MAWAWAIHKALGQKTSHLTPPQACREAHGHSSYEVQRKGTCWTCRVNLRVNYSLGDCGDGDSTAGEDENNKSDERHNTGVLHVIEVTSV